MTYAYIDGFYKTAVDHGVDPVKLIKIAVSGKLVRSGIGLARKIPDLAKLLDRHRHLISMRIVKSVASRAYEAADPILLSPVHGHLRFQDHFRLRRKLLQFIEEGKIPTQTGGQDLRRLANRIRFSIGRGSSSAFPDPKGIKTPVIEIALQKSKDLGDYISSNILRHEFGHIIDLHGTSFGRYLDRITKFTNTPSRYFWDKGLSLNPEIRANLAAGLPRITPATDAYFASDATPRELIDLIRKYPLPKPNLPK